MENPPQPTNESKGGHNPNHADDALKILRQLDWDFWANSAWAVLGLVVATFCVTPIFDFFNFTWKVVSIIAGFALAIGVVVVFVWRSRRLHQQGRTSAQLEEQAEEKQRQLRDKLDHLELELSAARQKLKDNEPRRLTLEQKQAIIKTMSPFRGTKISLKCRMGGFDDTGFAQDFVYAFQDAGLICEQIHSSMDMSNFENVIACLSKEDAIPGKYPESFLALSCVIANVGLIEDPNSHIVVPDLPSGELRLWVGRSPNRQILRPVSPFRFFRWINQAGEIITGITTPTMDSASQNPLPPPPQTPL